MQGAGGVAGGVELEEGGDAVAGHVGAEAGEAVGTVEGGGEGEAAGGVGEAGSVAQATEEGFGDHEERGAALPVALLVDGIAQVQEGDGDMARVAQGPAFAQVLFKAAAGGGKVFLVEGEHAEIGGGEREAATVVAGVAEVGDGLVVLRRDLFFAAAGAEQGEIVQGGDLAGLVAGAAEASERVRVGGLGRFPVAPAVVDQAKQILGDGNRDFVAQA